MLTGFFRHYIYYTGLGRVVHIHFVKSRPYSKKIRLNRASVSLRSSSLRSYLSYTLSLFLFLPTCSLFPCSVPCYVLSLSYSNNQNDGALISWRGGTLTCHPLLVDGGCAWRVFRSTRSVRVRPPVHLHVVFPLPLPLAWPAQCTPLLTSRHLTSRLASPRLLSQRPFALFTSGFG